MEVAASGLVDFRAQAWRPHSFLEIEKLLELCIKKMFYLDIEMLHSHHECDELSA